MIWHSALVASILLISQVSAAVLNDVATQSVRRHEIMDRSMRRYADSVVVPIERRQTFSSSTNATQWDTETAAACTTALETLNGDAGNPSGMAVCYNVPYLDTSTGVFKADLRLYMVSPPSGDFANVSSQNVMVGLQYSGATVSAVNASSLRRRFDRESLISWPRGVDEKEMEKRAAATPTLTQSYAFVGQINKDLVTPAMTKYVSRTNSNYGI